MKKTYIIGEIGINHQGDINIAKKLIDIAASAGCDECRKQRPQTSESPGTFRRDAGVSAYDDIPRATSRGPRRLPIDVRSPPVQVGRG